MQHFHAYWMRSAVHATMAYSHQTMLTNNTVRQRTAQKEPHKSYKAQVRQRSTQEEQNIEKVFSCFME